MPSNLQEIESRGSEHIRIENLHWAIVNEVREDQNWDNAYRLFSVYLAPVVLASQKAAESSTSARATSATSPQSNSNRNNNNNNNSNNSHNHSYNYNNDGNNSNNNNRNNRGNAANGTSKLIEFEPDSEGNYTHEMTERDVMLAQRSISALVRYAPSPDKSNIIYMFYLQCQPPFRNDDTINNCLISLIYRYAHVADPETMIKGLDLIKVALERGIGLPGYQAIKPANTRYRPPPPPDRQQKSILASVSKEILMLVNKTISDDGLSLVDYVRPRNLHQQSQRRGGQQQQQQQQQHSSSPHAVQQQHNQQTGGQQPGRHGRQGRQLLHSAQERGETTPSSHQEANNSISDNKVEPQQGSQNGNRKSGKGRAEYVAPVADEVDQYSYYKQASHGFEGTVRGRGRGRGGSRDGGRAGTYVPAGGSGSGLPSGHRTIAFVPASSNAALKPVIRSAEDGAEAKEASVPAPAKVAEKGGSNGRGAADELAAGIEKLQLGTQAE